MKSFKAYVLSEDINNWALSQLGKKFKNGHIDWKGLASNSKDIEELKELYKQEHPNYKEEELEALDVERIKKLADRANTRKDANKAFGGDKYEKGSLANDVANGNYSAAISKMDYIEANEKEKISKSIDAKNALKTLRNSLKPLLSAASVITEQNHRRRHRKPPVDGTSALNPETNGENSEYDDLVQDAIRRAEEADQALRSAGISIGDDYNNGTNGQRAQIIEDFINFINELCKGNDFISNDGGGKIISTLKNCARDNKLNILETKDAISSSTEILKKPTNLNFIVALLWLKTVAPELYKDALQTPGGTARANQGISDSVKQQYIKVINQLGDLILDKDFLKKLGDKIESFDAGSFKEKIINLTNDLKKRMTPEEIEKVKALQGRRTQAGDNPTPAPETKPNEQAGNNSNPTPEGKPNTQEEKPAEDTEEKPEEESSSNSLAKLNNSSSPEDVKNAVKEAFGTNNAGQVESKLLNAYYKRCDEVQKANSKMAAKSGESKVRTVAPEEPPVQEAEELVNLILEGRGNRLRLRQDAEATKAGWEDAKDELNKMAAGYLEQAEIIANGYTDTTPSKKRDSILLKLRSMYSSLALDLSKIFAKHKKSNSYGELGSILYNARMRKDANEQKKEAKYKNSEKGRRDAQIDEITTKKLPEAIEAFKKIDSEYETFAQVLSYGILHPNNLKDLAKAAWNDRSKETIGEICLKALSDNGEIEGLTIDTLQPLLSKLSQIKEILPTVQKRAAEYEEGTQYSNIEDDKNIYNKLSSKAIAFIGQMRSLGDKLTNKILLKDEVSSLSFKDYYNTIYEDEQQQQAQQSQNNVDLPNLSRDEKRAVAFAILATSNDEQELKTAAEYLSLVGKDGTPGGYIKAIEKYKKENAQAIAQVKAAIARQANAVLQQPQTQQVQQSVAQPQAPQAQSQTQQAQQPVAQQQPAQQPQQPIQATVTTSACGNFTIPDRLNKKLIRRKMGNTFFA